MYKKPLVRMVSRTKYVLLASALLLAPGALRLGAGDAAASSRVRFEDVTESMGLTLGGGRVAWADLDGDGWSDLVVGGRVWRNREGRGFEDVTEAAGLGPHGGAAVIADFDGDGRLDLYFTGRKGALFLNRGFPRFESAPTAPNPHVVQAAAAADLNNDGWVDLYLANYEIWKDQVDFPDLMLRNTGGKLELQWSAPPEKQMRARGVTGCDFDRDGKIDLYVSNYRLMPNFLWRNRGEWSFREEARRLECAGTERRDVTFKNSLGIEYFSSGHTIGSVWADFNNDTFFDLFVGNFSHPPEYQDRPMLLENSGPDGDYRFVDRSAEAALPWQESYSSPAAADVDNDGWIDLFFTTVYKGDTSRLFLNRGDWRMEDVTESAGIESRRTYQNAFGDFDNDGRLDLVTGGKLYRNLTEGGHWLKIDLVGKTPNTAAIGAQVVVESGTLRQVRQVEAGTGSGNQNDLRLHFGLGDRADPVQVSVRWPDGARSSHTLSPNRCAELTQE